MAKAEKTCLLSRQQLLDKYFLEFRSKILDIAAFLDRLDRVYLKEGGEDPRLKALYKIIDMLSSDNPDKAFCIQMILSDPMADLLSDRRKQNACGAPSGLSFLEN